MNTTLVFSWPFKAIFTNYFTNAFEGTWHIAAIAKTAVKKRLLMKYT